MAWSDLQPRTRALTRAGIFFVLILIISVFWNTADDPAMGVLQTRDVLIAGLGAMIYAGIMHLLDRRLIRKGEGGDHDSHG